MRIKYEKRRFVRKNLECVFKKEVYEDDKNLTEDEIISLFFPNETYNYYMLAKEMEFTGENKKNRAFDEMLQEKFYFLLASLYPAVYKNKSKINLSSGGMAFVNKSDLNINMEKAVIYIMMIFKSDFVPLFLKGKFVCHSEKQTGGDCQYVVQFSSLSSKTVKRLKAQTE